MRSCDFPARYCGDFLEEVVVVALVLLDLLGMDIEIQHAISEGVEEPSIMGDDDNAFFVFLEVASEVLDARLIQVVRRLIEQKQVGVLNECARKEKTSLLAS